MKPCNSSSSLTMICSMQFYSLGFLLCYSLLLPLRSSAEVNIEALSLLKMKNTLDVKTALSSWTDNTSPCNNSDINKRWRGIVCYRGHVSGLHLQHMGLSGTIDVDSLAHLHGLRSISLENNSFSTAIPDLGKLPGLKAIYLSYNQFNGSLSDGMFYNLPHLKKLLLSHNLLSGVIPNSISKLPNLLELRLEENSFEGNIPDIGLPSLKSFNVSNNLLQGRIPKGLQRFEKTSFEGNDGLCGKALGKVCDSDVTVDPMVPMPAEADSGKKAIVLMVLITTVLVLVAGMALMKRRREDGGEVIIGADYQVDVDSNHKWLQNKEFSDNRRNESVNKSADTKPAAPVADLVMLGKEKVFTMSDLMKASAEVLGSGGLGSAYKVVMSETMTVVVKRMKEMNRVGKEQFDNEMWKMGELNHPNVLTPLAYHFRTEEKLFVLDYVERGSLLYLLHGDRGPNHAALDWRTRSMIIRGIARGLLYLHEQLYGLQVPHGNLKSGNILLTNTYQPLLVDFAYTPLTNPQHATQVMFAYRSPESIRTGYVSPKSDVYCFGIVILEILTGKFPAQYLGTGKGGTDLVGWAQSAVSDGKVSDLLDPDLLGDGSGLDVMEWLVRIGLELADPNPDSRPNMREAAKKVEEAVAKVVVEV